KSHSLTYNSWIGMVQRCTNPKKDGYDRYGGRGIKVLFPSFKAFLKEVGERPSQKYSIDRINNDGNYEPGNVRWATAEQQASNRRKCHE
ncbi:MAG TPA: hypothetical protein VNX68_18965, partial [Nitrosopumilaceae archaeon]|nr:hypothetical protein [Nitrosopumilaceae archaeon]